MPSIVYWTNKRSGAVYAYSSESYWDKDKKAPRSKRTYLGRVDPETGEIIKGRHREKQQVKKIKEQPLEEVEDTAVKALREEVERLEEEVSRLKKSLGDLEKRHQQVIKSAKAATRALEAALSSEDTY